MPDSVPQVRSMREFCERYFPRRHAARECDCRPKLTPEQKFMERVAEIAKVANRA